MRALLLCAAAVALAGCATVSVTPPPRVPLASALPPAPETAQGWWMAATQDPALRAVVQAAGETAAVEGARARLAEAQARAAAARAALGPVVTATGEASRVDAGVGASVSSEAAGAALSFPVDLAGATRSRSAAARARAQAAALDVEAARIAARETAGLLFITLRTAQAQRLAAARGLASAEDSLSLARARQAAGLETGLGLAQAQTARDVAAARLPAFAAAITEASRGLEALLALQSGVLTGAEAEAAAGPPAIALEPLLAAPALQIEARPDIAAAAARLAAAGLDARAARADRFPTLSVAALVRDGPGPQTSSLGATLAATLFDSGRLSALARAAGAAAQAEAIAFDQTVRDAGAGIDAALARAQETRAAARAQAAAAASAREQARLAQVRYTSGLSDFLAVLTADRALYEAESAEAAARGEASAAALRLAAALGQG
jgi:multidrug efflux system outer membrane protein